MYARQLLATNAGKPGTEPDFGGNTAEEGRRVKPNSQKALPVETLSKRELEVLGCMAEGLSNRETARRLVIEISTVKRHINSIFGKLGASSRVQAINKAKENGILHD